MSLVVFEINSSVWLGEQPWTDADAPDLADLPDEIVAEWADRGIDVVWFLGIWTKGLATRNICRSDKDLQRAFSQVLPDLREDDIVGSPFSIADYAINPTLGKPDSLRRLREKLNRQGIRLMLDFVPNHMAVDHPWVDRHPERFIWGTEADLAREPGNYFQVPSNPDHILAHGRDPYFSGWTDTAQINIANRDTRWAMLGQLLDISDQCDGVRCDMAMLVTNDVFSHTWGDLSVVDYPYGSPPEFWEKAISAVKQRHPEFILMAEVYWDLERRLQEMGFDYTYDKTLYDQLRAGDGAAARTHLATTQDCQDRLVRFVENHDEERAADAFGPRQRAATTIMAALPGSHLYHEGQYDGRKVRLPVQLNRRPDEPTDAELIRFHDRLAELSREPVMREGRFHLVEIEPGWEGNTSHGALVACWRSMDGKDAERRLAVANISDHQAQAHARVPLDSLNCAIVEFRDLLSDVVYMRSRDQLAREGLYLDLASAQHHLFAVRPAPADAKPND